MASAQVISNGIHTDVFAARVIAPNGVDIKGIDTSGMSSHGVSTMSFVPNVLAPNGAATNGAHAPKKVFFFDIDNCLYPAKAGVHQRMADLIHTYFEKYLNLSPEGAVSLHAKYYKTYGLAIGGLMRFHRVDPLHFNSQVDDALPLEDLIQPRAELIRLLRDIKRSEVKLWLFTNAYVTHARRVVKILEIEDLFDGITFCDYTSIPFVSKPEKEMFKKAMAEAGVDKMEDCYFVDDNFYNCSMAEAIGWNSVHLVEDGAPVPEKQASKHQIGDLEELRGTFPHLFETTDDDME